MRWIINFYQELPSAVYLWRLSIYFHPHNLKKALFHTFNIGHAAHRLHQPAPSRYRGGGGEGGVKSWKFSSIPAVFSDHIQVHFRNIDWKSGL